MKKPHYRKRRNIGKKTRSIKGSGNKLTRALRKKGPSEEEQEKILDEEIVNVTPVSTPISSGRNTPSPTPYNDLKEYTKQKYADFLVDNISDVMEIRAHFDNILGNRPENLALKNKYLRKSLEDLSVKDKTYLSKYADNAEILRTYLNTADMVIELGDIKKMPVAIKAAFLDILGLYAMFPFISQLGLSSPEEGEDIEETVRRLKRAYGMEFSRAVYSPEEKRTKVLQTFVKDLKEARDEKKEGGKKSRKKKRKSRKKSRRKKRKHQ